MSCLLCSDGCRYCEGKPRTPSWFRGTTTKGHMGVKLRRVLQGLHPFGASLGPEESRCGTCARFRPAGHHARFPKCQNLDTSSATSDCRAAWRGCSAWTPQTKETA